MFVSLQFCVLPELLPHYIIVDKGLLRCCALHPYVSLLARQKGVISRVGADSSLCKVFTEAVAAKKNAESAGFSQIQSQVQTLYNT